MMATGPSSGLRNTVGSGMIRFVWNRSAAGVPSTVVAPLFGSTPPLRFGNVRRSEERRVGKECRSRGSPDREKKKDSGWGRVGGDVRCSPGRALRAVGAQGVRRRRGDGR